MCVCVCVRAHVLRGLLLISLDSDGVIMMMLLYCTIIISASHRGDSGSVSQPEGLFLYGLSVVLPPVQKHTHQGHLDSPVFLR